jgi:hypothetical protein
MQSDVLVQIFILIFSHNKKNHPSVTSLNQRVFSPLVSCLTDTPFLPSTLFPYSGRVWSFLNVREESLILKQQEIKLILELCRLSNMCCQDEYRVVDLKLYVVFGQMYSR